VVASLVIQDFEALIASGAYGGTRRFSPSTELMLISLYTYESLYRWTNNNGEPLTDEQKDTVENWTAIAQDELMREVGEVPIGSILPFAGKIVPGNALLCDGSTYQKDDWPELYAVLADDFIVSPTSFTTPDMGTRFIRGTSTLLDVGATGGQDTTTLSIANMPQHTHSYLNETFTISVQAGGGSVARFPQSSPIQTGSAGSGSSFTNLPRYLTARFIIIAR